MGECLTRINGRYRALQDNPIMVGNTLPQYPATGKQEPMQRAGRGILLSNYMFE